MNIICRQISKEPLVSKEINPQYPALYKVYEYDLMTEQGTRLYSGAWVIIHEDAQSDLCIISLWALL